MKHFILSLLLIISCAFVHGQIAVGKFGGSYLSQSVEKDSLNKPVQVLHKLTLQKDSTFSLQKFKGEEKCNNTIGGFWRSTNGEVLLEPIGEDEPIVLNIMQGQNFIALINKSQNLYLARNLPQPMPAPTGIVEPKRSSKKYKSQQCPKF
jgi:hypothetical protein